MDSRGTNKAATDEINTSGETLIIVRQIKHLDNKVQQDHWAANRITKPMLIFKSFRAPRNVPAGMKPMHIIREEQLVMEDYNARSFAYQFYALAAKIRHV